MFMKKENFVMTNNITTKTENVFANEKNNLVVNEWINFSNDATRWIMIFVFTDSK